MPKQMNAEEILRRNPQIDSKRLEEVRALHRRLREQGVQRKGYDLASPFARPRVSARDDAFGDEPRLGSFWKDTKPE